MESPERDRVRRALDELKPYLSAFVSQRGRAANTRREPDITSLVKAVLEDWERTYHTLLPPVARSYLHELRDVRNRWAHEQAFSPEEADRAVDTVRQLARLIGAPEPSIATRRESIPQESVAATASAAAPTADLRWSGQRAAMREIFTRVAGDEDRAVQEYVAAEREGRVRRKGNKSGLTAEQYARALIADGYRKGWLT